MSIALVCKADNINPVTHKHYKYRRFMLRSGNLRYEESALAAGFLLKSKSASLRRLHVVGLRATANSEDQKEFVLALQLRTCVVPLTSSGCRCDSPTITTDITNQDDSVGNITIQTPHI